MMKETRNVNFEISLLIQPVVHVLKMLGVGCIRVVVTNWCLAGGHTVAGFRAWQVFKPHTKLVVQLRTAAWLQTRLVGMICWQVLVLVV
jgi:hypothetical protein